MSYLFFSIVIITRRVKIYTVEVLLYGYLGSFDSSYIGGMSSMVVLTSSTAKAGHFELGGVIKGRVCPSPSYLTPFFRGQALKSPIHLVLSAMGSSVPTSGRVIRS